MPESTDTGSVVTISVDTGPANMGPTLQEYFESPIQLSKASSELCEYKYTGQRTTHYNPKGCTVYGPVLLSSASTASIIHMPEDLTCLPSFSSKTSSQNSSQLKSI